jgi:hypothetical protein
MKNLLKRIATRVFSNPRYIVKLHLVPYEIPGGMFYPTILDTRDRAFAESEFNRYKETHRVSFWHTTRFSADRLG